MAFNKAKTLQEAEKFVLQGKISQGIKLYLQILEKEPTEVALLNTVGDLYLREKNTAEALKNFNQLADCYLRDGFNVKAIAMYKKIAKLDPNAVEALMKVAELYQLQGLGREAREQYALALDYYKKKNLTEKALGVFQKIVALDPDNPKPRAALAEFCEQAGRKTEAAQAYLEAAEAATKRGDSAAFEAAVKKASSLDPKNQRVSILRARFALTGKHDPAEAEKVLTSLPDLNTNAAAQQLLLEAYVALKKLDAAAKLVGQVFHSNPDDFTPLSSFATLCLTQGAFDAALKPLAAVSDELIEKKNTGPLMEILRQMWTKSPRHVPMLELIHKICEQTADEGTLPEILEALGHAYAESGQLAKAEATFLKLSEREPANEQYKGLLKQVLEKEGKAVMPAAAQELSSLEIALTPDEEAASLRPAAAPGPDADEAAMVKEALENSDLFAKYNVLDKALAELDKALAIYPDQIDIHKRVLEICHRAQPERAVRAAEALSRIYVQRGDLATARKYDNLARTPGAPLPVEEIATPAAGGTLVAPAPLSPPAPEPAPASQPGAGSVEFDLSADFATGGTEPAPSPPPPQPTESPFGWASPANPPAAEASAQAVDLSTDFLTGAEQPPPAQPSGPPFNYEDTRVEIDFYLEQGFADEARKAVEALEEQFPGNPQVEELRQRVESYQGERAASEAAPAAEPQPELASAAAGGELSVPEEFSGVAPVEPAPVGEPEPPPLVETTFAEASPPPPPPPAPATGQNLLDSLANDLASSLDGLADSAPPPPAPTPPPRPATSARSAVPASPAASQPPSPLSGILEDLGEGSEVRKEEADAETHYNLGVAFREMGLLDEAIGEFQKVAKGARQGVFPLNFLQACSLLAVCFMEKKMPAIAAKWYLRALEAPDLDEEANLSLLYDLGVAYEQAGDARNALEKFSEVYSQNIDFRDVAEKVRQLQQKSS